MKDKLQKILLQPKWIVLIFVCVMYCIPQITKLGFIEGTAYENNEIPFEKGDMLFLYTDGLSEAKNTEKKSMGRSRVFQLVQTYSGDTARQLVEHMNAEAHQYAGEAEQSDDITMLVLKRK